MRKTLILVLSILFIAACKNETPKSYVTFSGKITNKFSDKITIKNNKNETIKVLKVAEDGSFKDTLHVSKGMYGFTDGREYGRLFLFPDSDLKLTLDTKQFDESMTFSGKGSDENNYAVTKQLLQEALFDNISLFDLPKEKFTVALDSIKESYDALLKAQDGLDPEFVMQDIEDNAGFIGYLSSKYDEMALINKLKGKASPVFQDYENINGGKTSLNDLKGKYVYIDIWATWCQPCLGEIPALKELEKEFGDKMHFVSISVDKQDKHDIWKQMVSDKALKGIQLFARSNESSHFMEDYKVSSIPRFILLDPKGLVVMPDASRPSNPNTKILFEHLLAK